MKILAGVHFRKASRRNNGNAETAAHTSASYGTRTVSESTVYCSYGFGRTIIGFESRCGNLELTRALSTSLAPHSSCLTASALPDIVKYETYSARPRLVPIQRTCNILGADPSCGDRDSTTALCHLCHCQSIAWLTLVAILFCLQYPLSTLGPMRL